SFIVGGGLDTLPHARAVAPVGRSFGAWEIRSALSRPPLPANGTGLARLRHPVRQDFSFPPRVRSQPYSPHHVAPRACRQPVARTPGVSDTRLRADLGVRVAGSYGMSPLPTHHTSKIGASTSGCPATTAPATPRTGCP